MQEEDVGRGWLTKFTVFSRHLLNKRGSWLVNCKKKYFVMLGLK